MGWRGEIQFALIPRKTIGEIKLDKGLGVVLAVDAGDNCFVGNTEGSVGGVFLDVDNGAREDNLLDLIAGDNVCRGSGGGCTSEGSEDGDSGGENSRLHFDVWLLDWEVGIKSEK